MATSKEGTISYISSETRALVRQTKSNLEEKFGLFYDHGKPKVFSEEEKKELEPLREELDDLVNMMNTFQQHLSQVLDIQMRPEHEKGRLEINERDSGIDSKYVPSPRSSTDPLARSNRESTNRDSMFRKYIALTESRNPTSSSTRSNTNDENGSNEYETTSLQNISASSTHNVDDKGDKCFTSPAEVSDKPDSVTRPKTYSDTQTNASGPDESERTSFYLGSSPSASSVSSSSGSEACQFLPSSSSLSSADDPSSVSDGETKKTKQLNDISKPPSEEDNTKQA